MLLTALFILNELHFKYLFITYLDYFFFLLLWYNSLLDSLEKKKV